MKLRPYQREAVRALVTGIDGEQCYLLTDPVAGLIMPTGAGKSITVIAALRDMEKVER